MRFAECPYIGILHAPGVIFCQISKAAGRIRAALQERLWIAERDLLSRTYLYPILSGLFALHAHLRFVENRRIQLAFGRLRGIMLARTIAGHSLGTLLLAHIIITSTVELDADSIAATGSFGNQSLAQAPIINGSDPSYTNRFDSAPSLSLLGRVSAST